MDQLHKPMLIVAIALVSGCGGNSNFADGRPFQVSADTISIKANGAARTLPVAPTYDSGPFIAATDTSKSFPIELALVSETDATYGALFVWDFPEIADDINIAPLFGRTGDAPTLPSGTAQLRGDYVGVRTPAGLGNLSGPVTGAAVLDVNFDDQSVSGRITDRVLSADLFNPDEPVTNATPLGDITLLETDLTADGTFAGDARFVNDGNTIDLQEGTFQGLLGGVGASEAVGEVRLPFLRRDMNLAGTDEITTAIARGEVGVFVAGH